MTAVPEMRQPRNHARRVEDLQALDEHGLLRYLEARKTDNGSREYVVHIDGEPQPRSLPSRGIDLWLDGARSVLTALATRGPRIFGRAGHTDGDDTTRRNTDGPDPDQQ